MSAFSTIVMDPPWPETGGGGRGAQHHYGVLPWDDVPQVITTAPVWRPADDAHLYLWVTRTSLPHALHLMPTLGFRYVGWIVWAKSTSGLGQYFRGKSELMLFGVRGQGYKVRTDRRDLSDLQWLDDWIVTSSGRLAHSEKPRAAYDLIEARSHGPYLEMFARDSRPGWTVWGNEVAA